MFCLFLFCARHLSLTVGLAALAAAGARAGALEPAPTGSVSCAWLETARQIAVKIPSDVHGVERDRALADAATVALDLGCEAQAERTVRDIGGWRRGDLYARYAARCFSTGRLPAGERFLELARAEAQAAGLEEWQASRIRLGVERAQQCRPSAPAASAAGVAGLEPADQAALLPDLVSRSVAISNLTDALFRLEAVTNQVLDLDAAAATVDAYRVLYQKSGCGGQADAHRDRVMAGVRAVFASLHPAIACEKLIDFGEAALQMGDTNLVGLARTEVETRLPLVRADMRAPVQARYARLLGRCGAAASARASLEGAADLLTDPAVLPDERAALWARIGAAWQELGERERSLAAFGRALDELPALTNARPRAVAAAQVCAALARAALADERLQIRMNAVRDGLAAPW